MPILPLLIIGAGPCGLAVAARLREHTPSATFTDDEHQRYHWIRNHGKKMNIKSHETYMHSLPTPPPTPKGSDCGCEREENEIGDRIRMLVLDAEGDSWMSRWNRLFKAFSIDHLRSPMFFHIDPSDRDSLLSYTYASSRESELLPLSGCVGKEVSKHKKKKRRNGNVNGNGRISNGGLDIDERDRKDYATPSRELFESHCEDVVKRYGLHKKNMIRKENVLHIEYEEVSSFRARGIKGLEDLEDKDEKEKKVFRVTTDRGVHFARIVILAIGPGTAPSIPSIPGLSPLPTPTTAHEAYTHAMHLSLTTFPPPHLKTKIANRLETNILIVGGGLTSIQLADLAIQRGVKKVWLLMRGPLKVKYFDVDLDWVGKFRNFHQAAFWSAESDDERLKMLLQARNGGSITPAYREILDQHVSNGSISLHTHTTLTSVRYDSLSRTWTNVTSTPPVAFPAIDYIIFATGVQSNITGIPFLHTLQQKYPVDVIGDLPCLDDDLMWRDDVPMFVTGRLAGLRLGPGAPNLVGARIGAERIAWNVEEILRKGGLGSRRREGAGVGASEDEGGETLEEFAAGRRNRFDSLVDIDDDNGALDISPG